MQQPFSWSVSLASLFVLFKKTVKIMHSKARLSYCIEGEITSKIQYTTHHRLLLFILIARVKDSSDVNTVQSKTKWACAVASNLRQI